MKKIILLFAASLFLYSCDEFANPLDPAKGIDSQGETTLFMGRVTDSSTGAVIKNAKITCSESGWYYYSTSPLLWETTTDSEGYYIIREDVSDCDYDLKLEVIFPPDTEVKASFEIEGVPVNEEDDPDRTSRFKPIIKKDFKIIP